jgi:hypothetical protein
MKFTGRLLLFTLILVAMATACKFYFGPDLDWSGFSPFIAIALFSGMIIRDRGVSFLLPLLSLFISDAVIHVLFKEGLFPYAGFYDGQWKQYAILVLCTLMGLLLQGKTYRNLVIGAIAAPTLFFLVSNFNVWISQEVLYAQDFNGLMACYTAALPFYKNALIATVVFLPVILFTYNYMMARKPQLILAKA